MPVTPPNGVDVPVIHCVSELYKKIYQIGSNLSKKDKLGIHLQIEKTCLVLFDLLISAAFDNGVNKLPCLIESRIKTESLKRLIRIENDLQILASKKYLELESDLQEISKMINGWIKYLNREPR